MRGSAQLGAQFAHVIAIKWSVLLRPLSLFLLLLLLSIYRAPNVGHWKAAAPSGQAKSAHICDCFRSRSQAGGAQQLRLVRLAALFPTVAPPAGSRV